MTANWGAIAIEIESEDAAGKYSAYKFGGGLPSIVSVVGRHTSTTARTLGITPAQMDEWKAVVLGGERNLRSWVLSFQRLQGMAGVNNYTNNPAAITPTGTGADSDVWMQWRGIHYFEGTGIAAYMKARGMEPIITFWASNNHATKGFETPFVRWEDATNWASTIAEITLFARAAAAEGFVGLGIDGEMYGYATGPYGDTSNTAWGPNYHGRTCTIPEAHTFARLRGEQMADAILAEMPGAVWWSYSTDLPGSNRALVHGSDTFYATNTSVDFLAGLGSRSGWSRFHIVDPSFYKGTQAWGNDSFANYCDAIRKGQMDAASSFCDQLTDTEWDNLAPKLTFPPFIWLTPGPAGELRMTHGKADVAMRAAVYATCGDWWWLYTQQAAGHVLETTDAVGTGYDYDEFEDIFQAYGTASYGDEASTPIVTITTNSGANFSTPTATLDIAGTAVGGASALDPGGKHAIHYVEWYNITTGDQGQCRFDFVNDTPNWDAADLTGTKPPNNGARLLWHLAWSKDSTGNHSIALVPGSNLIVIIAYDAKGNTGSDTITVTRSAVVEAAASASGQNPKASIEVTAAPATASTVTSSAPATEPSAVPATVSASANSPTITIATNPAATLLVGAGQVASVSTITSGIAAVAADAATAENPSVAVRSSAENVTLTASAEDPSVTTAAPGAAGVASATSSANDATVALSVSPATSTATGTAEDPHTTVSLGAQSVAVTAAALNAVVGGSTIGVATAESATALGVAFDAAAVEEPRIYVPSESADATASAANPSVAVSTPVESADVSAMSDDVSAIVGPAAAVAAVSGVGEDPSLGSNAAAGTATGTAGTDNPSIAVGASAEVVTALATGENTGSASQAAAEVADAVALAENPTTGQTHDVADVQTAGASGAGLDAASALRVNAGAAMASAASEDPVALIGMFLALFFEGGSRVSVSEGSDA